MFLVTRFVISLVLSLCGMIFTSNSIVSLLWLLNIFCQCVILLLYYEAEYSASTYIVVYAGAIIILFSFIIMLLNIYIVYAQNYFIIILIFFMLLSMYVCKELYTDSIYFLYDYETNVINYISAYNDVEIQGYILYNYAFILPLMISFFLLICIVGTLFLTDDNFSKK